ncbi:MAG: glycosyltransferase family 4 protein [Candidatus Omnitrophota bacterium]
MIKKINILYYDPTSGLGGSSRCLLSWLGKIDREKFHPIVAVHHNGPAIENIRKMDLEVINIPYKQRSTKRDGFIFAYLSLLVNFMLFDIPTALFLIRLAKKYRISLFHLNAKIISIIPGIIASRILGIPCICHLHDIKEPVNRERFFAKWINCFVVLTEKARELYIKQYPNRRIELIPNGIDINEYNPAVYNDGIRKEFHISSQERIIVIVGRLVEGKGFSDFIRAAKILTPRIKKVRFMVVGASPSSNKRFEHSLKEMVNNLRLDKDIIFTGWRNDVKNIIASSDILVQASSTFPEGFGLTVIEAMALSKPVVVTDVPGPSELIINGVNGYVVPSANPAKLAAALEDMVNHPELIEKMGEAGRRRVRDLFNLDITVKRIETLYSDILSNQAGKL